MAVLANRFLDFVIELPCGKVMLFTKIDHCEVYCNTYESADHWRVIDLGHWDIRKIGLKRRKFWIKQELKVLREQNKKLRKSAWFNFVALQEKDYLARESMGALDRTEVRLTFDERLKLYERAATALYGSPQG